MKQAPEAVDLERLNDAERKVLSLLAEGHTAKSIAPLAGLSVAAINERLREARRKTGVGSSRELARLLRTQKSEDEKMGMAIAPPDEASINTGNALLTPGAGGKGLIVVGTLAVAGIAAGLFLLQGTPNSSSAPNAPSDVAQTEPMAKDPLLGGMAGSPELEPRQLYRRVRIEPRDPLWADRTKAALERHYGDLSAAGLVADLRILCASTVCEVAGSMGEQPKPIDAAMRALQDAERDKPIIELGLTRQSAAFGHGPTGHRHVFGIYWVRSASRG